MKTTQPVNDGCDPYMFKGQKVFQTVLLMIALCCVPVLLMGTPLYVNKQNKKMRDELMVRLQSILNSDRGLKYSHITLTYSYNISVLSNRNGKLSKACLLRYYHHTFKTGLEYS